MNGKKIKVLYFLDYPLDSIGGAQLSTLAISQELKHRNGYDIKIVTPSLTSSYGHDSDVIEYPFMADSRLYSFFKKFLIYKKVLQEENPDCIHVQMPFSCVIIGIILKLHASWKCKFIYTDRGFVADYSWKNRFLFRYIAHRIDYFVCTTMINLNNWKRYISESKLRLIYNFVTNEFDQASKIHIPRDDYDGGIVLGFAGRYCALKNWPLALNICKKLADTEMNFYIKCAMTAFTEDEKREMDLFLKELKSVVGSNRFSVSLDVSQNEMASFYSSVDVFILTSKAEPFGKTAIEAMACGCCVIGTDCGGLPEVIGRSDNVFPLDNADKCISIIQRYNDDRDTLKSDKKFFSDRYNSLFSRQSNIEKYLSLYTATTRNHLV